MSTLDSKFNAMFVTSFLKTNSRSSRILACNMDLLKIRYNTTHNLREKFTRFFCISGVIDPSTYISVGYNEAGAKTFTCTMCGKGFKNNAHVRTHIENVHAGEKVQCGVCQKILKNKQSLITHSSVMHGLTKYQIYSN